MRLFFNCTSAHRWWPNQWRLLLSTSAYTLIETILSIGSFTDFRQIPPAHSSAA